MNTVNSGTVINLQICPEKGSPLTSIEQAEFISGHGIVGDAHSGKLENRQVLLMDSETQEAFEIGPDITRENLTTKNLDLSTLNRGDILTLGTSVKLEVTGDCEPCRNLDSKRPGLSREIKGKRGILCRVIGPGFVKVNDEIACEAKQL